MSDRTGHITKQFAPATPTRFMVSVQATRRPISETALFDSRREAAQLYFMASEGIPDLPSFLGRFHALFGLTDIPRGSSLGPLLPSVHFQLKVKSRDRRLLLSPFSPCSRTIRSFFRPLHKRFGYRRERTTKHLLHSRSRTIHTKLDEPQTEFESKLLRVGGAVSHF